MHGLREAMNATTNSEAFGKLCAVLLTAGPIVVGLIIGLAHNVH